jgi:hypothetical protein
MDEQFLDWPYECLATESGVVLQNIGDISDPVVFLSGTSTVSLSIESGI